MTLLEEDSRCCFVAGTFSSSSLLSLLDWLRRDVGSGWCAYEVVVPKEVQRDDVTTTNASTGQKTSRSGHQEKVQQHTTRVKTSCTWSSRSSIVINSVCDVVVTNCERVKRRVDSFEVCDDGGRKKPHHRFVCLDEPVFCLGTLKICACRRTMDRRKTDGHATTIGCDFCQTVSWRCGTFDLMERET